MTNKLINIFCIIIIIGFGFSCTATAKLNDRVEQLQKEKSILIQEQTTNINMIDNQAAQIEQYKADIRVKNDIAKDQAAEIDKLKKDVKDLKNDLNASRGLPTRTGLTAAEINLLYKVVESESGNEPISGRIAVTNTILNRIKDKRFPNTLQGVIYQPHQYEVVSNGMIDYKVASASTKAAVNRALNGENNIGDCISFWATYLSKDHELWNLRIDHQIGGHVFTSDY